MKKKLKKEEEKENEKKEKNYNNNEKEEEDIQVRVQDQVFVHQFHWALFLILAVFTHGVLRKISNFKKIEILNLSNLNLVV